MVYLSWRDSHTVDCDDNGCYLLSPGQRRRRCKHRLMVLGCATMIAAVVLGLTTTVVARFSMIGDDNIAHENIKYAKHTPSVMCNVYRLAEEDKKKVWIFFLLFLFFFILLFSKGAWHLFIYFLFTAQPSFVRHTQSAYPTVRSISPYVWLHTKDSAILPILAKYRYFSFDTNTLSIDTDVFY